MRRTGTGYSIDPATSDWLELPASRGFAGYGLGRALGLLLDAMQGLSALNETATASGERFAHGEFAPLQFRVDPLGVCRLVPLTTRHYISEDVPPPRATLGFLSPERLTADKVGVRADVFSAGVLLWEALAGRRLTDEASSEVTAQRLLGQKLLVPPLPPQLAWATPLKVEVERALSLNQQRRFADCAEFSAVILRLARDRVASHAEIAAFFAANLQPSPSSAPASHERLVTRGATLKMPPVPASADPASNSGAAAGVARRHDTLKMNVTLSMAQVPLVTAIDVPPALTGPSDNAQRGFEEETCFQPADANARLEGLAPLPPPPRRSLSQLLSSSMIIPQAAALSRAITPASTPRLPAPSGAITPPSLPHSQLSSPVPVAPPPSPLRKLTLLAPLSPEPQPTPRSRPPLPLPAMAPSPLRRQTPAAPVPPLPPSLRRSTPPLPPPRPSRSTPLPQAPSVTQCEDELAHAVPPAPPSIPALAEGPLESLAPTNPTQSSTLPEIGFVARSSAQPWIYRRRWIAAAAASLIGAIIGFDVVATRGARNAATLGGTSQARSASAATAPSATPAPVCCSDAPSVGASDDTSRASNAEHKNASAASSAAVPPNVERAAGPPAPAPRGRPPPSAAAQTHRDYGI